MAIRLLDVVLGGPPEMLWDGHGVKIMVQGQGPQIHYGGQVTSQHGGRSAIGACPRRLLREFLTGHEAFRIVRISFDESNTIVRERGDLQDYNEHVYCWKAYRYNVEYVHGPMNNEHVYCWKAYPYEYENYSGRLVLEIKIRIVKRFKPRDQRLDLVANTGPSTSQDANVKHEKATVSSSCSEQIAVPKREHLNTIHETKPASRSTHYDTPKNWTHDRKAWIPLSKLNEYILISCSSTFLVDMEDERRRQPAPAIPAQAKVPAQNICSTNQPQTKNLLIPQTRSQVDQSSDILNKPLLDLNSRRPLHFIRGPVGLVNVKSKSIPVRYHAPVIYNQGPVDIVDVKSKSIPARYHAPFIYNRGPVDIVDVKSKSVPARYHAPVIYNRGPVDIVNVKSKTIPARYHAPVIYNRGPVDIVDVKSKTIPARYHAPVIYNRGPVDIVNVKSKTIPARYHAPVIYNRGPVDIVDVKSKFVPARYHAPFIYNRGPVDIVDVKSKSVPARYHAPVIYNRGPVDIVDVKSKTIPARYHAPFIYNRGPVDIVDVKSKSIPARYHAPVIYNRGPVDIVDVKSKFVPARYHAPFIYNRGPVDIVDVKSKSVPARYHAPVIYNRGPVDIVDVKSKSIPARYHAPFIYNRGPVDIVDVKSKSVPAQHGKTSKSQYGRHRGNPTMSSSAELARLLLRRDLWAQNFCLKHIWRYASRQVFNFACVFKHTASFALEGQLAPSYCECIVEWYMQTEARHTKWLMRYDGNTARLARRSDDALGVRASVARIASSLLDLVRGFPTGVHPTLKMNHRETIGFNEA
ncbi:hypothetical protein PR048_011450, partial [Dryococelus australis]